MPRHSTPEQRMAELQHLMALPPQGLLQLAGDEIENRWPRAPALRTVREAEHSGRGVDSALRLAYETLIELDAGVDEEGMRMLVALEKRLSKRGRRANPPLSEHMAHDDLKEIADMLAERFLHSGIRSTLYFEDFVRLLAAKVIAGAESADTSDMLEADAFRTLAASGRTVRSALSPYRARV